MTLRALFRLLALKLPVFAIALHATALFAEGAPSESVGKFETETQAVRAVPGALAYEFSGGRLLAFTADGNFAEVADDGRALEGTITPGAQSVLLFSSTDELLLLAKIERDWRGFRLRVNDRSVNVLGEVSLPSGLTPLSAAHSSGNWLMAADDSASATSVLVRVFLRGRHGSQVLEHAITPDRALEQIAAWREIPILRMVCDSPSVRDKLEGLAPVGCLRGARFMDGGP